MRKSRNYITFIAVILMLTLSIAGSAECRSYFRRYWNYNNGNCYATCPPAATPTNTPAINVTKAPASVGTSSSSLASQVISQVNSERANYGYGALTEDSALTSAACVRAKEIVEKFSHTRPDGSKWSTVSSKAYGENIAKGYKTVDKVMAAWMSSEGHRENILHSTYTTIGVCAYEVDGVMYWVQLFGTGK